MQKLNLIKSVKVVLSSLVIICTSSTPSWADYNSPRFYRSSEPADPKIFLTLSEALTRSVEYQNSLLPAVFKGRFCYLKGKEPMGHTDWVLTFIYPEETWDRQGGGMMDAYVWPTACNNYLHQKLRTSVTADKVYKCPSESQYSSIKHICYAPPPTPKQNGGGCDDSTKQPIKIGTGNKWLLEPDTYNLTFNRYYNSQLTYGNAHIGTAWVHSFSSKIASVSSDNNFVYAFRPDGKQFIFNNIAGLWKPDADISDTLIELKDITGIRTGWIYTNSDDQKETYSANGEMDGKLLSITDRAGLVQTLSYSCNTVSATCPVVTPLTIAPRSDLLIKVTDNRGHSLNFTYDNMNRIASMTNSAGGVTSYTYSTDGSNNLASVTYPDGKVKTYHYENTTFGNALTGITDENGVRYASYFYDALGRATSEFLAGGADTASLVFNTDASGNPSSTVLTDARGSARTYNFTTIFGVVKSTGQSQPGGSGCSASSSAITYDTNGNVSSRTDFDGHKTTYVYDLNRNLETSRTEGLSATEVATSATRIITTTWHATWRLPLVISEYTGATATGTPVKKTTQVYDAKGNLISTNETDPVLGLNRTTTMTYTYSADVPGLVLTKVVNGPRTDVNDLTTYTYYPHDAVCTDSSAAPIDPANPVPNLGCRGELQSVKNALNQTTTYNHYNHHGQVEQMTDVNGLVTQYTYDLRQRLTSRKTGNETTTLIYDNAGQIIQLQMPDSRVLTYTYDAAHRLTQVQDTLGNKAVYTLDAEGNRIQEDTKDPNGTLAKTLTRSYDALNRLQTVTGVE